MNEVQELVEKSYDKIAMEYYRHRDLNKFNSELDKFISLLSKNAIILDVGCGAGIPTAKYLFQKGINVIGIDISDVMLKMARENVPDGKFIKMDITNLQFDENSFDGIISVYTLFHVKKEQHHSVFKQFHKILKPGGILLINTGINDSEGISDFFGAPMFWSNHDPKITLNLVQKTGFSIIFEGILIRGGEFQYWIFGRKNY
ncbi:MAG: class I SAM-dependent methyltransferase [Promethearchaeota archaeon]